MVSPVASASAAIGRSASSIRLRPDEPAAREAQHYRPGAEAPALPLLLHEAVALERAQQS